MPPLDGGRDLEKEENLEVVEYLLGWERKGNPRVKSAIWH
jgi:hypothetical protein